MLEDTDTAVLARSHHGVAKHVDPEADVTWVGVYTLHDLLGDHIPEYDLAVLAGAGNKSGLGLGPGGAGALCAHPVTPCAIWRVSVAGVSFGLVSCFGSRFLNGQEAKAAANGELFVVMALVGFFNGARDVVPETDGVVKIVSQDEAPIGRETDRGHRRIVFVYEGSEALAGVGVPYATR